MPGQGKKDEGGIMNDELKNRLQPFIVPNSSFIISERPHA
jgi:hypothetical protein